MLKGRDLFSASLFREPESTRLFYAFIAELKAKIDLAHPGPTHRFIKTLDAKGKLLRSYTQNIDGFEEKAGIQGAVALKGKVKKFNAKDTKNVQLHGDIQWVVLILVSPSTIDSSHVFLSVAYDVLCVVRATLARNCTSMLSLMARLLTVPSALLEVRPLFSDRARTTEDVYTVYR